MSLSDEMRAKIEEQVQAELRRYTEPPTFYTSDQRSEATRYAESLIKEVIEVKVAEAFGLKRNPWASPNKMDRDRWDAGYNPKAPGHKIIEVEVNKIKNALDAEFQEVMQLSEERRKSIISICRSTYERHIFEEMEKLIRDEAKRRASQVLAELKSCEG